MAAEVRFESWKEIAAYLRRDVRTVQRWEASEGLPVHRHQHKKRGSVYALQHELDAWRESRRAELFTPGPGDGPEPGADLSRSSSRASGPRWWVGVAVLVAAIGGLVWGRDAIRRPATPPAEPVADAPRLFGEALREGGATDRIPLNATEASLALSPDDATLFAAYCRPGESMVVALQLPAGTPRWRLPGIKQCARLTLSADGRRLYVIDSPDVVAVDAATGEAHRIRTPAASISGLALTPDGRTLYAAAAFGGLLRIDTANGTVRSISRLPCPIAVALTPGGDRLYVNYQCSGPGGRPGHDVIDILDTGTDQSIGTIKGLPNVGAELFVSPDGTQLWADTADACLSAQYDHDGCPEGEGGVINVIRTSDHARVRALRVAPAGAHTVRLTPTPDGRRVIAGRRQVTVIDAAALAPAEWSPQAIRSNAVFSADGRAAYFLWGDHAGIAVLPLAPHPAPPPGLTARWTLDGVGTDLAGENALGPLEPAMFAGGRIGLGLAVDPARLLRLEAPSNLNIDGGFVTAMAWVRGAGTGPGPVPILEYGTTDTSGFTGWRLARLPDGRAAVCLGSQAASCDTPGSTLVAGTSRLAPNAWHHVAFTRDRTAVTLYVNGRAEGHGTFDRGLASRDGLWLRLGSAEADPAVWDGRLDEIEIYSRTLTPEEIATRGK